MRTIDADNLEKRIVELVHTPVVRSLFIDIVKGEQTVIPEHRKSVDIISQILENQEMIMLAMEQYGPVEISHNLEVCRYKTRTILGKDGHKLL